MESMNQNRPVGIIIVAVFAILAGLGEIVVGFTGNYLGILSTSIRPAFSTVIIGAFYSLGGLALLITRKKLGAVLSIIFIGAEILGHVYLVMSGVAPSNGTDAVKIFIGGAIALALILIYWIEMEFLPLIMSRLSW
jgi:uncharacterized membrane protein